MAPRASFLIRNLLLLDRLHLIENYLVVSYETEAAKTGESYIVDTHCQHDGVETCEHRRRLPVGFARDLDSCADMLAVLGMRQCTIRVWDLKAGTQCRTLTGQTGMLSCVLFPNPSTIIAGGWDGSLIVWDVSSGTRQHTLKEGLSTGDTNRISALKAHENVLVSGNQSGTVRIWNLNSGQFLHVLEGHDRSIMSLEFNADHSLLATGASGGEMKVWNINSGACVATCLGHTWPINQFSTDPDDTSLLVSASADGWIRTWKWSTGALIREL